MQTNYNEGVVLQQVGDVLMKNIRHKRVNTHKGQRDVGGNKETEKENGSSNDNLELFYTASV